MDEYPHTQSAPPAGRKRHIASHLRGHRPGKTILRSTAVLPAMFTMVNGLAGFASIYFATKGAADFTTRMWNLTAAGVLIFVALACDMLDGRLARMTRRTSDFGGQLDSLCDIISFGVAPAMLMFQTVILALSGQIERIDFLPDSVNIERAVWCVAAVYLAFAILRLARFNVENVPDESAHMSFRGLPTPGAAAVVASLVLLFCRLSRIETGWRSSTWAIATVAVTMPVAALTVAMLMVSRFKYSHIINQYARGRRPFGYLVKLVVILPFALWQPFVTAAALSCIYALSGPLAAAWTRLRPIKTTEPDNADTPDAP